MHEEGKIRDLSDLRKGEVFVRLLVFKRSGFACLGSYAAAIMTL